MADTPSSTSSSSITDDPTSKVPVKAKVANTIIGADVISSLPDEVLCYILSFFPTRNAVATCVLSKRWKRLWISVPNLDFTLDNPLPVNPSNFMNFLDKVLSRNSVVYVRKVHLHLQWIENEEDCDSSRVGAWTRSLAGRDTEKFSLRLPPSCCIKNLDEIPNMISLPDSFFIRENLVVLWLENIALKVPTSVYFPSLKTIHFDLVQFLDDDPMKNLLAGCPILDELHLKIGEVWDNAQKLSICSPTLSYFNLSASSCSYKTSGYKVVIEAPDLITLNLADSGNVDYDIKNVSSLEEADVNLERESIVPPDGSVYNERIFKVFSKISHTQYLLVTTNTLLAMQFTFVEILPMFNNLTYLKMEFESFCWPILPHLLGCSPVLVYFILEIEKDYHPHSLCVWHEPPHVPQCLLSSLETVRITGVEECDAEIKMVHYILDNAMVLEKMEIVSYNLDTKTELAILKQLVASPRSSNTCQVEYVNNK